MPLYSSLLMPVFVIGMVLAIAWMLYLTFASPQSQAKFIKNMPMGGQMKRSIKVQLILALEDPEIRAMLYDAMQEESRLRREK